MQRQLTEIIVGYDQGVECKVKITDKDGLSVNYTPFVHNNFLKVNQFIYDYLDNNTILKVTLTDTNQKGKDSVQSLDLYYNSKFKFASITYKPNPAFQFFGNLKVVKSNNFNKDLFTIKAE